MSHQTYTTERLEIRPVNTTDAPFLFELMNSPKWLAFIGDRNIRSVETAFAFIKTNLLPQFENAGFGTYCVIRKSDQVKLGTCGLYDREGINGIDLGFAFLPAHERQGYAYESATKIIEAAHQDFHLTELHAITSKQNVASQNLLKKLGFLFIEHLQLPNDPEEIMHYSLNL